MLVGLSFHAFNFVIDVSFIFQGAKISKNPDTCQTNIGIFFVGRGFLTLLRVRSNNRNARGETSVVGEGEVELLALHISPCHLDADGIAKLVLRVMATTYDHKVLLVEVVVVTT